MLSHTCLMPEVADTRADASHDWLAQFFRRISKRVGQIRCGMTGHDVLLRYQPTRLSLQCATCGYESPGWELGPARAPLSCSRARFSPPVTA